MTTLIKGKQIKTEDFVKGTQSNELDWNNDDVNTASQKAIAAYIASLLPSSNTDILVNTTSYWDSYSQVPAEGVVIVYSDYDTTEIEGVTTYVPAIKIGNGTDYVQDLGFVGDDIRDDLLSHIGNSTVHITAAERSSWNSRLNVNDNMEVVNETLMFIRN